MVRPLKEVIMKRDNLTSEQADEQIAEAKDELQECIKNGDFFGAEDVLSSNFGLEPDYLEDLL